MTTALHRTWRTYAAVLAVPGARRLAVIALFSRLPATGVSVVMTLFVVASLGRSYGEAGLCATVFTLGMAVGQPWRGHVLNRRGLTRAVIGPSLLSVVLWGVSVLVGYPGFLLIAFALGFWAVPAFTVVRLAWGSIVTGDAMRPAFALDSILLELSFMVGPGVVAALAQGTSPTVAAEVLGVAGLLAGLGLLATPYRAPEPAPEPAPDPAPEPSPEPSLAPRSGVRALLRRPDEPGRGPGRGATWATPRVIQLLALSLAATWALGGTDVSIIAMLRGLDEFLLTGPVFIAWGVGSITGALVVGALRRPIHPALLVAGLGLLTIPMSLAPSGLWLIVLVVPAGAFCAPVLSVTAQQISSLVPDGSRAVAMGWYTTALSVGTALGAPACGVAIDRWSPGAGFVVAGVGGIVLALMGAVRTRTTAAEAIRSEHDGAGSVLS